MKVVYASNDNYARHLGTSLCSLLDNNREMEEITAYILSVNLSQENQQNLRRIVDAFGRKMEIIELGDVKGKFAYEIDTGGFDISTMSRLFIGDVLPQDVDRVIYMDCDTVVLRSLKRMWDTGLGSNLVGAVMEPTIYEPVKAAIDLGVQDPYFNAGVLLIDLKSWREQQVQRRLLEFYESKGGQLFACDQDAINGALKGKIKPLSPTFNYFTNYRYFSYEELVRQAPWYHMIPKDVFLRAGKRPAVVHFMGDERPWVAGNLNHYRRAYDTYLAKTPWRGSPKEKGKELYMLLYHMMDYLTVICPAARRGISRKFGMKAVDARKK